MSEPRYVPRPHKRSGASIPVHIMRRFFNFLGDGRCVGIEVSHRGALHGVTIHFDTSAEASGFYRSIEAIYNLTPPGKPRAPLPLVGEK